MAYTLDQLSSFYDVLNQRVNSLDGQHLVAPTTGAVPQLNSNVASLKTDNNQIVLSFQELLLEYQTALNNAINRINTLTGAAQGTGTINVIN